MWWDGPSLITKDFVPSTQISEFPLDDATKAELKPVPDTSLVITLHSNCFNDILNITNCYSKIIRVLAFILRFADNARNVNAKRSGPLSTAELLSARNCLLRHVQVSSFSEEIKALKKGQPVSSSSKLKHLNPFIDKENLIRVGGRLCHSNLSFDAKHPIVLPAHNQFTKMLFEHYHKRDLHAGPQSLLCTVRQIFWPINGRNMSRQVVHNCVKCFRTKPIGIEQIMGDLPPVRVKPSPPFSNAGIDLCGPFSIKTKNQRKGAFQKVYVVIFVCMVTKATHFETVSDLSAATLIAALKRFFARRGKSLFIFSDNATNFKGANSELKRLLALASPPNLEVPNFLSSEGVTWRFLPPRAPNFGGLWESGVKSFKYHLKRALGTTKLTLEEFLTVTIQIEGILNSRPLSPLSADINDFEVLTPGHFLIGRPINALAEPSLINKKDNLLSRWQLTQKFVQTIWKAWNNTFLSHLQQRNKWLFTKQNVRPGMLVIIKDPQIPVCKWSLGRIAEIIRGADGNVRVVNVNTPKGLIKRSIAKLCVLPIVDNQELP